MTDQKPGPCPNCGGELDRTGDWIECYGFNNSDDGGCEYETNIRAHQLIVDQLAKIKAQRDDLLEAAKRVDRNAIGDARHSRRGLRAAIASVEEEK